MTDDPQRRNAAANAPKGNPTWGGRFAGGPSLIMQEINASIDVDRKLWRQDIRGSLAHAAMLAKIGVLDATDEAAIRGGLEAIAQQIEAGTFAFDTALEDIHMNIEARLTERIGEAGRRLAEGRNLVSTTFVVPYPPGFPVLVPGQVVSKEILYFLAQLNVKEIHGYNPELGLSVFTAEALTRMEAQRSAATAAVGSATPVFELPSDASGLSGSTNGESVKRVLAEDA